jgi:hypothetical protein
VDQKKKKKREHLSFLLFESSVERYQPRQSIPFQVVFLWKEENHTSLNRTSLSSQSHTYMSCATRDNMMTEIVDIMSIDKISFSPLLAS